MFNLCRENPLAPFVFALILAPALLAQANTASPGSNPTQPGHLIPSPISDFPSSMNGWLPKPAHILIAACNKSPLPDHSDTAAIILNCFRVNSYVVSYMMDKKKHFPTSKDLADFALAASERICALGDLEGCMKYVSILNEIGPGSHASEAINILSTPECSKDWRCDDQKMKFRIEMRRAGTPLSPQPSSWQEPAGDNPPLTLVPLSSVPQALEEKMAEFTYDKFDAPPKEVLMFKQSVEDCAATPQKTVPTDEIGFQCWQVWSQLRFFLDVGGKGSDFGANWATKNHYIPESINLLRTASVRACALRARNGCWANEQTNEFIAGIKRNAEIKAEMEAYERSQPKTSSTHDILNAISDGLNSVSDTLDQHNQEQATHNAEQMDRAKQMVADNDARRAEGTGQSPFHFAPTKSAAPSTSPNNGTVAPPVAYQKPPSTGGTVVASGAVCPASGYTFTSYGDAATGVPCTPGQPIAGSTSSGSGSGGSAGSSSGSSAGSGIKTTPVLTNCLAQSYVDGDLTVTNTCNVPVYATWWINGHGGSWTLNPGEHTGTGYSSSDVAVGGASYYVCPKNASPTDSSGNALTWPVSSYVCVVRY